MNSLLSRLLFSKPLDSAPPGTMSDIRAHRQSSRAALSDMQSSNSALREKFGRMCRQTDRFSTEYQESYQPNEFNALQAKKHVKKASKQVHSSKKLSQKKTQKSIEAELVSSTKSHQSQSSTADKENSQLSNSQADNFSDAPSAASYMSSVLQSGRLSQDYNSVASSSLDIPSSHPLDTDHHFTTTSEFSEEPEASSKPARMKRISESTAKYIKWPLPEHVPNHGPADHDMITDLNTASLVKNWQSVAHAQMQASAAQIAMANNRQDVNPPMVIRNAHASDTPRFFAWSEAAEGLEVEKKVLTFDNAHSEYRDCYVKKQPLQRTRPAIPPSDHQVLSFATSSSGKDEIDWRSTAHLEMEVAAQAREEVKERGEAGRESVAGVSSKFLAEHMTGREAPPPAPVFFAWKSDCMTPSAVSQDPREREDVSTTVSRDRNVHTESSDNYIKFASVQTKRVPPPEDHNILANVTSHPTPMVYESVAHSQMTDAQKAQEAAYESSKQVSGSTSSFLKKDYRKSYAPGYFAWPIPQQFAETTPASHDNVHTEYRDNYLENKAEAGAVVRVSRPEDHNVLGCAETIDPTIWRSTAASQMKDLEQTVVDKVAGASSAFLAKDTNNLCPPGFFAWPVVPQTAVKNKQRNSNKNTPHSEYADSFVGTAQNHIIQEPPADHDVIVGCLDADQSSQWQSVAQSQMEAVKDKDFVQDKDLSLTKANHEYRHSYAPDYFAWPVKDQHAERTVEASANVHTEYKDSYVKDSNAAGVTRAPHPEDHVQIGTDSEDLSPANWKSNATHQNESSNSDCHQNGQDIVFKKSSQSVQSTPSFFVWPKEETVPKTSRKNTRNCGYGDAICSEYDSKFVEIDFQNVRVSPVKVTQTIPVNELDPSVWQSTTQRDMEGSLRAGATNAKQIAVDLYAHPSHSKVGRAELDDKPMNFAWKPAPTPQKVAEVGTSPTKKKNKCQNSTESSRSYIDWTPAVHAMHEHHLAEQESNTNTLQPHASAHSKSTTKRRDVKFSGESETHSRFQAWSPIAPTKTGSLTASATASILSGGGATVKSSRKAVDTSKANKIIKENLKTHISTPSTSVATSTANSVSSGSSATHSMKEKGHFSGQETVDSAAFSTDSLDNRSTASIAGSSTSVSTSVGSSRQWHASDDINALRQTSRLGLRGDISQEIASHPRPRATSAPTRRRPLNIASTPFYAIPATPLRPHRSWVKARVGPPRQQASTLGNNLLQNTMTSQLHKTTATYPLNKGRL